MTDRVRGLLITPDCDLLTIRRIRPGDRTGPEFSDPARGGYQLQLIP
jgi:hypothetical protein